MWTRRRVLLLVLALLGLLLVGGAVSIFNGAGGPSVDDALATLRTRSTPVLYLGKRFEDAKLTRVREDGERVVFDYGGGVQVQHAPLAGRNPVRYLRVS